MTRHHGVLAHVAADMLQELHIERFVISILLDCYGEPEGDDLYAEVASRYNTSCGDER